MAGKIEIRYLGNADLKKKVKGFRNATKRALFTYIYRWHKRYLPRHFILEAYQIYPNVIRKRYKPRTREEYYEDIRNYGVTWANTGAARHARDKLRRPMFLSGQLRRNVSRIRVSGTSNSARGTLPGSQVANFHVSTGERGYNMPAELRHVNDQEKNILVRETEQELLEFLNKAEPEHHVKFPIVG